MNVYFLHIFPIFAFRARRRIFHPLCVLFSCMHAMWDRRFIHRNKTLRFQKSPSCFSNNRLPWIIQFVDREKRTNKQSISLIQLEHIDIYTHTYTQVCVFLCVCWACDIWHSVTSLMHGFYVVSSGYLLFTPLFFFLFFLFCRLSFLQASKFKGMCLLAGAFFFQTSSKQILCCTLIEQIFLLALKKTFFLLFCFFFSFSLNQHNPFESWMCVCVLFTCLFDE